MLLVFNRSNSSQTTCSVIQSRTEAMAKVHYNRLILKYLVLSIVKRKMATFLGPCLNKHFQRCNLGCGQTSPARLKQICQCGFLASDIGFFGMKLAVTSITILIILILSNVNHQ